MERSRKRAHVRRMVPNKKSHKIPIHRHSSRPWLFRRAAAFSKVLTQNFLFKRGARIKVTSCRPAASAAAARKRLTKLLKRRRHHILFIWLSVPPVPALSLALAPSTPMYVYSFIPLRLVFWAGVLWWHRAEIEIL